MHVSPAFLLRLLLAVDKVSIEVIKDKVIPPENKHM